MAAATVARRGRRRSTWPRIGALPAGLPAPSLGFLDPGAVGALLPSALAVAALAALESLLSATVADGMSVGQRHDPDRELFGQGLANLAAPLFGGIPATAAIARTAVNVRAGARSKLAALTHARRARRDRAGRRAAGRPDPARRAGRRAARHRRYGWSRPASLLRAGPLDPRRRAGAGADLRASRSRSTWSPPSRSASPWRWCSRCARWPAAPGWNRSPLDAGDHSAEEHALLAEHIVAYRLDGPLFFAAAHRFLLELSEVADVRVVILRMSRVPTIDATGATCSATRSAGWSAAGSPCCCPASRPATTRCSPPSGWPTHLRRDGLVFPDTPAAIDHARELLRGTVTT